MAQGAEQCLPTAEILGMRRGLMAKLWFFYENMFLLAEQTSCLIMILKTLVAGWENSHERAEYLVVSQKNAEHQSGIVWNTWTKSRGYRIHWQDVAVQLPSMLTWRGKGTEWIRFWHYSCDFCIRHWIGVVRQHCRIRDFRVVSLNS